MENMSELNCTNLQSISMPKGSIQRRLRQAASTDLEIRKSGQGISKEAWRDESLAVKILRLSLATSNDIKFPALNISKLVIHQLKPTAVKPPGSTLLAISLPNGKLRRKAICF